MKFKTVVVVAVFGLVGIAASLLMSLSKEEAALGIVQPQLLSAAEFKTGLQLTPNAVIVDVRTPGEYSAGHIPGAVNIDFKSPTFAALVQQLNPTVPYFVYCHSGNRSASAVALMQQLGMQNITELRGGIVGASELLVLKIASTTATVGTIIVDVGASSTEQISLASVPTSISLDDQAGLIYMREEEKLAHDVYVTLGQKWNLPIFSNIASSEQTHTEAVKQLLVHYGVTDPVTDSTVGVFSNRDLQKLYTDLTAKGMKSLEEALIAGATIEDLDIYDLKQRIAKTDANDITAVYENLMKGSRNHMRSFYEQLLSQGFVYQAQYISSTELEQIVASAKETGGGMMKGRPW